MTHPSTDTRGLSPPTSELDGLLERRERAETLLRQGIDMIAEASALTPDRQGGLAKIGMASELRSQDWYSVNEADKRERLVSKCLAEYDRCGWLYLLKRSQIGDVMSRQDKEAYYETLQKDPPPLTRENVTTTFVDLFGNRQATWRRGVVELFASLSGKYRSHDAFKIGKRLVIEHAFSDFGGWNFYRHADDQVNDLQRVIALIEGRDLPDDKLSSIVERWRRDGETEVHSGPLTLRWFRNGNLAVCVCYEHWARSDVGEWWVAAFNSAAFKPVDEPFWPGA